jgi:hypothetical protein
MENFAIFRTLTEYDTFSLIQHFVPVLHVHRIKWTTCLGPSTLNHLQFCPTGTYKVMSYFTRAACEGLTVTELVVNMNI